MPTPPLDRTYSEITPLTPRGSPEREYLRSKLVDRACRVVVVLAILNFCCFIGSDVVSGGSADAGKVQGGRYYVGEHGRYTRSRKVNGSSIELLV